VLSIATGHTIKWRLAIALCAVMVGAPAQAQLSQGDGPPSETSQDAAPPQPAQPAAPYRDFLIELAAPIVYSTNPALASSDLVQGHAVGDWHFNPDLALRWSHQFSAVRVSTVVDASVDRFFKQTEDDEDTVFGSVKVAWTDGRSDRFVPYLQYVATADLRPDFGEPDDVLHDFVLGVSDAIGIDAEGRLIPRSDATKPGRWRLGLDLKAGRRLADPKDFESTIVQATLDLSYVLDEQWILAVLPRVRVRWYDDFFGEFRRDEKLGAALKARWMPDWLLAWNRGAEIDFRVGFERNYSTLDLARFSDWDIGPTLFLSWRF
jgi:hypothetical protein